MDFINNDGSYAHRGVWHITDNLTQKVVPARTHSYPEADPIYVTHFPEYIKYKGDAICGQRNGMTQGGTSHTYGMYRKKRDENGQVVQHERVLRPDIVLGLDGYIPGPLCSRCAKKAGLDV